MFPREKLNQYQKAQTATSAVPVFYSHILPATVIDSLAAITLFPRVYAANTKELLFPTDKFPGIHSQLVA